MQTEEKRENIEEKKEERMEMPVSGALEQGPGKAPVSGAEISVFHDSTFLPISGTLGIQHLNTF